MKRTNVDEVATFDDAVLHHGADIFRAAGDAGRLKLLVRLMRSEATVTELTAFAALPMSTVSQQLRTLRTAHLVKRRRSGKQLIYSLADEHVRDLFAIALTHASHTRRVAL
jgi:ArsR family transcriptional regulator